MKKIILLPNTDKDSDYAITLAAAALLHKGGASLFAESKHSLLGGKQGISLYDKTSFPNGAECILVFGGDGSILDAAGMALTHGIPLLGVNLGRLGYLAEIEISELDTVVKILTDDYIIREMQTFVVEDEDGNRATRLAVNEVAVSRGPEAHIADLSVSAAGGELQYRADGIIVSTPVGSTAYSLSAGGSVLDPTLNVFSVTPICPHSFFARSLVFSADNAVLVKNLNNRGEPLVATIDGRESITLPAGKSITISKSSVPLKILSLKKRPFLDVLKKKMCL